MAPNRRELVQALVQALRGGDCHFRRGVLTTLSDAPGDKQPGGLVLDHVRPALNEHELLAAGTAVSGA